jgi:hypothetical protein
MAVYTPAEKFNKKIETASLEDLTAWLDTHYETTFHEDSECLSTPCQWCTVDRTVKTLKRIAESKLPGNLPRPPEGYGHKYYSCDASDLKVGMFARYLSRPGSADYPYEYAELKEIVREGLSVITWWQKTNSGDAPFTAVYASDDGVNVWEYVSYKPKN